MRLLKQVCFIAACLIAVLLSAYSIRPTRKPAADAHQVPQSPPAHSWFIESYENGVITARHDGNTYRARCDSSRSFNNAASVTDPNNVHVFPTCGQIAGEVVGRHIQPLQAQLAGQAQRDPDGYITMMWNVGSTLALQSWKDEHTPWREDGFVITSITSSTAAGSDPLRIK